MTLSIVTGFLVGNGNSIRAVASSRAAIWTGLLLVLLTAIARNYDQTFILENPFLWLFGSLLFSLFSGAWIFLVAYGIAWGYMSTDRPRMWSAWPAFMGLFWMTAPIAWLYAIPVERFLDSLTAARANVLLLAIVSIWRVLLMTRVFQVLHGARFLMALSWVLIPVTVEVLVLAVFGGGLSKRIMAGMMGMRNSPEEEILLRSMSTATSIALCILPAAILTAVVWRVKTPAIPLPQRMTGPIPWLPISFAALFWLTVAILPQRELSKNAEIESFIAAKQYRGALDYLSAHRPNDFAPSRSLPPMPFEFEIFEHLPPLIAASKSSDSLWVQQHLLFRLDQMCGHLTSRSNRFRNDSGTPNERIEQTARGMQWAFSVGRQDAVGLRAMLNGLERMPAGHDWLQSNGLFLSALAQYASEAVPNADTNVEWQALKVYVQTLSTNSPPSKSRQ